MEIVREIYDIWTENGRMEAGLADKFLDGRVDALSFFMKAGDNEHPRENDEIEVRMGGRAV